MSFFRRKNMKKYTYRKFLILLFMINLIAITAVYIKYCNARLPDTIHINKSETVSLCYDVPVSATIDHQTIRLNQPIVFKQCHMGQYEMKTNLFGAIPLKKIKVKVVDDQKITPSGEVIGKSSADLTTAEFCEFCDQVEAYAATHLGVTFYDLEAHG